MRLSYDGHYALARHGVQQDPLSGHLFAFINRRATQIKVLYFDRTGGILPSSPLLAALSYIRDRRTGLSVYLDDPDVAIDTNHLERALRVIPMGCRNWLFAWTELGAKQIGIVQSLLAACRLHDINPYDYFVDVLPRVGQHPASRVHELTPRLWKQLFVRDPLRSDLHHTALRGKHSAE